MRIGASLFLIAVGAILRFAVTKHVNGVDIQTIGLVLIIVGVVGFVLTLILIGMRRRTDVIYHDGRRTRGATYLEPNDPADPLV